MLVALSTDDAALVLRRTGWVALKRHEIVQIVIHVLSLCKLQHLRTTIHALKLQASAYVFIGGTPRPEGGLPVLGPRVRGDSWSGGTPGPPRTPV